MPEQTVMGLAGPASAAGVHSYAASLPQNMIVAQEVNLGVVRDFEPPQQHIGLSLVAPWLSVASDDVVFDYVRGASSGLAPARAEDAESTLWSEDEFASNRGSASVIDWALKNHYTASDVTRYREMLKVIELTNGGGDFPLTVRSITDGFQAKVARHTQMRSQFLYNRIEWLIMTGLSAGRIQYNDGKISFDVNYGRPTDQHNQAPVSGTYASDTHDPINDILAIVKIVYDRTGVTLKKAICSSAYLNTLYKSSKFRILTGFAPGTLTASDMQYALPGWGPKAAIDTIEAETGVKFIVDDNVLRTRALDSTTFVNTRYVPETQVIFLPDEAEIEAYDNTEIGFAKTLTSPHPMGNWQTGFYSWERETTDPWGQDIGTGVKAFPVFTHLETTYTMQVTLT